MTVDHEYLTSQLGTAEHVWQMTMQYSELSAAQALTWPSGANWIAFRTWGHQGHVTIFTDGLPDEGGRECRRAQPAEALAEIKRLLECTPPDRMAGSATWAFA
jgi:hypothetical protein